MRRTRAPKLRIEAAEKAMGTDLRAFRNTISFSHKHTHTLNCMFTYFFCYITNHSLSLSPDLQKNTNIQTIILFLFIAHKKFRLDFNNNDFI